VSSSSPTAVQPRVLTDVIPGDRVRDVLLSAGFALAIALSALVYFYMPGNPVPVTGQTFVVLAGAIALGARRATGGALLYLGLGAAGLPLFAASNGATFGYIVGFAAASALLGAVAQRGWLRTVPSVTAAMVVGNLVIYAFGVAWVAAAFQLQPGFLAAFGFDGTPSLGVLLATFVGPFLVGDAVKIALAIAVVPTLWKLVDRRRDA
jgi:biotin transport system substrate-specific component